jgi:uncharacterized protein (DUF3820 family)
MSCKKCNHPVFVYTKKGNHIGQYCAKCGAWQKWMPQNNPIDVMPFGKYKGQNINDIQDKSYLTWLKENLSSGQINMKNPGKLIEAIEKSLSLQ